jgi:hypothetical protein
MKIGGRWVENSGVATFVRPTLGTTARTVVVAFFDEAVDEGLLGAWTQCVGSVDDVTLMLVGREPEGEMIARAAPLAEQLGLSQPDSADVALLPCAPRLDERVAEEADFLYSRREVAGPFGRLPRVDCPDRFATERRARRHKGVFVVGMHRSGTSAITRLINMLGVPLTIPGDLLLPGPDNTAGFWESSVAVAVSNTLLERLGGDVFDPPELAPGWEVAEPLAAVRWEARESLAGVLRADAWVMKDPRTCLTLPFFLAVMEVDPVIVMPYRNPLEVARSLAARDALPSDRAMDLWVRYVRSSLEVTEGLPVSVHGFEDLVANPVRHAERLHAFLEAHGIPVRDLDDATLREVGAFISTELRHHHRPVDEFRRSATQEQLALYEQLVTADHAGRRNYGRRMRLHSGRSTSNPPLPTQEGWLPSLVPCDEPSPSSFSPRSP